ncbi:ROK family transcriptional regulator [Alicyclobacillus tolerans]|uniref:ROK family transcriptional regulator n=1 Tax=Alicyclobacillus tolerans TaxID=90970 RepID=UPI001F1C361E|nr:ROK family transcriptional regulator [Alicyclobacillus tolerans]MCF8566678.1 ROK family transcriptional regulator [Alicyclobacillus tolerans]
MLKSRASRPSDLKNENRAAILRYVYDNGVTSKPDISKSLGISKPTVSALVDELVAEHWLEPYGVGTSTTQGGKPPILYRFNSRAGSVIGLHLGVDTLESAVVDLEMNLLVRSRIRYSRSDVIKALDTISSAIQSLVDKSRELGIEVLGIGVSAPGVIQSRKGVLVKATHLQGWVDVPIGPYLSEQFELPVWVDNESRNSALAEQWFGAGRDLNTFVTLLTKGGIGAGIIANGAIYRGVDDSAGEIGHTTIDIHGPTCQCGNQGCWELYASEGALLERFTQALQRERPAALTALLERIEDGETLTIDDLVTPYLGKEPFTLAQLKDYAYFLGVGITSLVNVFNPEVVFLHGNLSGFGEQLLEDIERIVKSRALSLPAKRVRVKYSRFGNGMTVIGAATLVIREVIDGELLFGKTAMYDESP